MNFTIWSLCLALATNEVFHNNIEIQGMLGKLRRLQAYISKQPFNEFPVNINTRAKSYTIAVVAFFIFVGPLWVFYSWLNLDQQTTINLVAILLVLAYIVTGIKVDKWHVEIEKITKPFKKSTKK